MRLLPTLVRVAALAAPRLVNTVLLAALLAGIPYGLLTQLGSPLPRRLPTTDQLRHLITAPVSDTLVLDLLALALWILWAAFLVSVVVEVLAAIRGVPRPRWGPIAPLQTLAGWLVAGVTAGVLAAAPMIAITGHAAPAAAAAAAVAPAPARPTPTSSPARSGPPAPVSATTATGPTTVDGATRITPTGNTRPGTAQSPIYQVRHGDWLGGIAQRFLGDFDAYPQITRLNPDLVTDPNLIEPGWRLILPAAAVDRGPGTHATGPLIITPPATNPPPGNPAATNPRPASPHPTPRGGPAGPAPSAAPGTPVSPPAASSAPPTSITTPTSGAPTTPRSATTTSATATGQADATPHQDPPAQQPAHEHGVTLPGGWIDLPLAAALAAAAAMVWRRRRHRYIPQPLTAPDDGDDRDLRPLPPVVNRVRGALREHTPALLHPPTHTAPTVADYRATDTQHRPDLPPVGPSGPDLAGFGDRVPAGGLGLVGPGAEAAARSLLIATLSSGTPADPDATGQVIIPAGALTTLLGADAVQIGDIPRLQVTADLSDALTRAEELLIERRRLLQDYEATDLATMHATDPYHPPIPPVLLLAEAPAGELRARLTTALHLGGPLQINAVLLGDWPRGDTLTVPADGRTNDTSIRRLAVLDVPTTLQLLQVLREAHTGQPATTVPVDAPATPDLVAPPPAADLPDTPATASGEDQPAPTPHDALPQCDAGPPPNAPHPSTTGAATPTATAPDTTPADPDPDPDRDLQRPRRAPVRIRLLGEPTIIDRDGNPVHGLRHHARELLVYLAVHRSGADLSQIMESFWPTATVRRAGERLSTEVGDLRRRIRQAAADKDIQPVINTGSRYHLNPDLLDIDIWCLVDTLRQAAGTTDPTTRAPLLRQAINAHTGTLAEGHDYDWIDQPREQLRRHAIRARLDLAALLADARPREAAHLTRAAVALDPLNEDLARRAMRALARIGDATAVRAILNQLRTTLDDIDEEPSAETIALAAQLQRDIATNGARGTDERGARADSRATP